MLLGYNVSGTSLQVLFTCLPAAVKLAGSSNTSHVMVQVFVDEITCIGCTNCVGVCPKTFEMQWEEHGRARAIQQDVDQYDDLQEAIETCPVNCIHRYNTWIRLAWDHMTWAEVICY